MEALSEAKIISTMEELVRYGTIMYGPYEVIEEDCEGYPMEFRICPAFLKKPHHVGASLGEGFNKSRKWGPGSDMYCPDERLILAKLNGTHDLALNMFSADKPQLILLTLDSYRRQHEPLDADDFAAALEVLRKFDSMYVIYNCTETGGCSRIHKHLQALKGPPKAFEVLMQQPENGASKVPFQYFTHQFDQDFKATSASDLRVVHEKLLGQAKRVLGIPESSGICPHNLVLWRDTMIVIPRRSGAFEGATANAAGMMGSVWVPEPKGLDAWKRLGPRNILQEFGVPLP